MTSQGLRATTRAQWSWALADWAREPFFSIVLSLIFPPFFVSTVVADPIRGTVLWGYGISAASAALVFLSPLAGAAADSTGRRKPWIMVCMAGVAGGMTSLWWATSGPGYIIWALASVAVTQLAVELSRIFTDSMVLRVASQEGVGRLSGLAVSLGFTASLIYLGAVIIAAGTGVSTDEVSTTVQRGATVLCGLWLVVFMLPLLIYCPDYPTEARSWLETSRESWRRLKNSLRDVVRIPGVGRFLLARMAYWDGMMGLFSFIAILASSRLQWRAAEISIFGLLGLLVSSGSGLVAGWLDRRYGSKRVLAVGIGLMLVVACLMLLVMPDDGTPAAAEELFRSAHDRLFLALAVVASGCVGIILASSRTMMVGLSPPDRLGEFFGLYVMVGRASSFAAPLLVATTTALLDDQMAGVFGVAITFLLLGLLLLARVPTQHH